MFLLLVFLLLGICNKERAFYQTYSLAFLPITMHQHYIPILISLFLCSLIQPTIITFSHCLRPISIASNLYSILPTNTYITYLVILYSPRLLTNLQSSRLLHNSISPIPTSASRCYPVTTMIFTNNDKRKLISLVFNGI